MKKIHFQKKTKVEKIKSIFKITFSIMLTLAVMYLVFVRGFDTMYDEISNLGTPFIIFFDLLAMIGISSYLWVLMEFIRKELYGKEKIQKGENN